MLEGRLPEPSREHRLVERTAAIGALGCVEIGMKRIEPAGPTERDHRLDREVLGYRQSLARRLAVEATNAMGMPAEQQRLMREIGPGGAGIEAVRDIVDHFTPPLEAQFREYHDQRRCTA